MENQGAVETLNKIHDGTFVIVDSYTALASLVEVIKLLDNRLGELQRYIDNRVPHL